MFETMTQAQLLELLDDANPVVRLSALRTLAARPQPPVPDEGFEDVNSHVHTRFSFSPYYPAKAVWLAKQAGLATVGIMDHDSIAGAAEFHLAGQVMNIATTAGTELRINMRNTPFGDRRLNNPDQTGIAYVTFHGVTPPAYEKMAQFLSRYTPHRAMRNRRMVENLNEIMAPMGITLNYDTDVVPLSEVGGSVTERHLLYALSLRMIETFGRGQALVDVLEGPMALEIGGKVRGFLLDTENSCYAYDLLGALKSALVPRIYVNADAECPDVQDALQAAKDMGAILAYAYLGDVGDSVTGDKRAQPFEDSYLDELVPYLAKLGFNAITYMPSRNTLAQLRRIRALCDQYGLMQISGEDINSPRQSFICKAQRDPEFENLITAAWALIGHERSAKTDLNGAIFSEASLARTPDLEARIGEFAELGRGN